MATIGQTTIRSFGRAPNAYSVVRWPVAKMFTLVDHEWMISRFVCISRCCGSILPQQQGWTKAVDTFILHWCAVVWWTGDGRWRRVTSASAYIQHESGCNILWRHIRFRSSTSAARWRTWNTCILIGSVMMSRKQCCVFKPKEEDGPLLYKLKNTRRPIYICMMLLWRNIVWDVWIIPLFPHYCSYCRFNEDERRMCAIWISRQFIRLSFKTAREFHDWSQRTSV